MMKKTLLALAPTWIALATLTLALLISADPVRCQTATETVTATFTVNPTETATSTPVGPTTTPTGTLTPPPELKKDVYGCAIATQPHRGTVLLIVGALVVLAGRVRKLNRR